MLPKVVLHDHLDGGMRPATLIDLAAASGHTLPETEPAKLAAWFNQSGSGSLVEYLKAFDQTVALLQTPAAIERATFELAWDHAEDGVRYLEIRYAAELSEIPMESTIEAMLAGASRAEATCDITVRVIIDAMRQADRALEAARAAVTAGAAGFDLAGPEMGFPASRLSAACQHVLDHGLGLTIHAGEADGPSSIADALSVGAQRIGHGVRIIEDCLVRDGDITDLGPVASEVHTRRIPLEICITSNLQTMNTPLSEHPMGMLYRAGFAVTLNTDNRLMSATNMVAEFEQAQQSAEFDVSDFGAITKNALHGAFIPNNLKEEIWQASIAAAYPTVSY